MLSANEIENHFHFVDCVQGIEVRNMLSASEIENHFRYILYFK